jgi:acetyl esterase/lipase
MRIRGFCRISGLQRLGLIEWSAGPERRSSRLARGVRRDLESLEGRALLSGGPAALAAAQGGLRSEFAGVKVNGSVRGVTTQRNVVYTVDDGHGMKLDLYRPMGTPPPGGWPAVVALPGGGWRWASKTQYGSVVGQLASYGFVVAVADYTFASSAPGSHVWPRNLQDARDAVRWVRSSAARLKVNPAEIAAEGVSSGAHLASLLGTYPGPALADAPPSSPTAAGTPSGVSAQVEAVVDFYGPVDLAALYSESPEDDPFLVTFLGGTPQPVPGRYAASSVNTYISPVDPPFFIVQGTTDQATNPTQSDLLASDLKQAGVPYSLEFLVGLGHGFEFRINDQLDLLPQVVTFLNEAFAHQPITTATTTT